MVWVAGVLVYAVAILQRSSFGVAGLTAAERFGASAGLVSTFVMLQLGVYSLAQVPVGVFLDRFGSRAMLAGGAVLMAAGQTMVGLSDTVSLAIAGRILVGLGDAMTFNSAIRLVPYWFPPHQAPVLTQLTGLLGAIGQIGSAIPFLAILSHQGWTPAFLAAAGASVVALALALGVVRNAPAGAWRPSRAATPADLAANLRLVLASPGTQLGFWIHFTTCFSSMMFPFMWGFPYMTRGLGLSDATASGFLTFSAIIGIPMGPLLGRLTAAHPVRRPALALATIWSQILCWAAMLVWPGTPPTWLLALLIVALASGGPGSTIAFDYARTEHPPKRVGTATGVTITGGFLAGVITILLIGLSLDATSGGTAYGPADLRIAMATQFPIYAIGLTGIVVAVRKLRRHEAAAGHPVPPWPVALRREWHKHIG